MSQQFQFLDIVFLGIIVLLLVNRLRSVLGTRPSSDDGREPEIREEKAPVSKVVDISEFRTLESKTGAKMEYDVEAGKDFEQDSEVIQNLKKIKELFPSFDLVDFMQKAPRAFEYIALAFAAGNKTDLQPLLSRDIYKNFEKAIDDRNSKNQTAEFSLIGFKSIQLTKAELMGTVVDLTVEFETEQTNITKDENGALVAGDPTYIETVTDVWTFRRDMTSTGPAWVLTATHDKNK